MARTTFKITAVTDVGLVRTNNEDNLVAISDLNVADSTWKSDEICELGDRGALLVVADGMGGMNAGEVASEIAISTIKEIFTEQITDSVLASSESIIAFMNDAILTADKRIKSEGKHRPDAKGMGTTIVVAWLYKGLLYVSWCGDSRAYIFNQEMGLVRITKDHSYVQELVDNGVLRPEDAFDFPESNIITRCLSHSTIKAEPDNLKVPYRVVSGDIILLCTDGLCGMIRDFEIANIISSHTDSMAECATALIDAAKAASGSDNITVDLCQILTDGDEIQETPTAHLNDFVQHKTLADGDTGRHRTPKEGESPSLPGNYTRTQFIYKKRGPSKKLVIILAVIVVLLGAGIIVGNIFLKGKQASPAVETTDPLADNGQDIIVDEATTSEPVQPADTALTINL